MDKKVLVVDLDGTLYNANTFHKFLIFLLRYYLKKVKIFKLITLIVFLKFRFVRIISHARLKYQVLKLIRNEDLDIEAFVSHLEKDKNEIKEILNSEFDIKILATAAPLFYAQAIANQNNFDVCLATDFPENGFISNFENLGKEKKIRLLKYLKTNGLKIVDTFVTDHEDDIPIVKMAKHNIIINPNDEFSAWLKENLVNFEIRKIE